MFGGEHDKFLREAMVAAKVVAMNSMSSGVGGTLPLKRFRIKAVTKVIKQAHVGSAAGQGVGGGVDRAGANDVYDT